MKYLGVVSISLFIIVLILLSRFEEGFESKQCLQYTACNACTNSSGCAWCPKMNKCLDGTTLNTADQLCNQDNSIFTAMGCDIQSAEHSLAEHSPEFASHHTVIKDPIAGKALGVYSHAERVRDRPKPPNIGVVYKLE